MPNCTHCQKRPAITFTTFEYYCQLSKNSINALVANSWNLPIPTSYHYSETNIAQELNCSAQKIGRTANKLGLKTQQYGEWRLDQATNCRKQIETFWYNDAGKQRLIEQIKGNDQL